MPSTSPVKSSSNALVSLIPAIVLVIVGPGVLYFLLDRAAGATWVLLWVGVVLVAAVGVGLQLRRRKRTD